MSTAWERMQQRAAQARERQQQETERLAQDRVQAWEAMQREAPDLASLLVTVRYVFGDLELIRAAWNVRDDGGGL